MQSSSPSLSTRQATRLTRAILLRSSCAVASWLTRASSMIERRPVPRRTSLLVVGPKLPRRAGQACSNSSSNSSRRSTLVHSRWYPARRRARGRCVHLLERGRGSQAVVIKSAGWMTPCYRVSRLNSSLAVKNADDKTELYISFVADKDGQLLSTSHLMV